MSGSKYTIESGWMFLCHTIFASHNKVTGRTNTPQRPLPFTTNVCLKPILKAYCLITSASSTTIPTRLKAFLDCIVWLTSTPPYPLCQEPFQQGTSASLDGSKSLNGITSTGYDSLDHQGTSRLRVQKFQRVQIAEFYMNYVLQQAVTLVWCRFSASKTKLLFE